MTAVLSDIQELSLLHHTQAFDVRSHDYPHATWRLLITPPLDGAMNMAIDEAILCALAEGHGTPTLRFFQWAPPCLSLGYNQRWREVDEAACSRWGYTWTRRPTGGRAILHADEFTYSLILPQQDPRMRGGIAESYLALSRGFLRGLALLGVRAGQTEKDEASAPFHSNGDGPVCFDTPSNHEIHWRGKKLIGSAQLRRRGVALQHGTLPLSGDLNRIFDILDFPPEERVRRKKRLPQRALTLAKVLGRECSFQEVASAVAEGFRLQFNLTLQCLPLTEQEQDLADRLRAGHYANDRWNKRI